MFLLHFSPKGWGIYLQTGIFTLQGKYLRCLLYPSLGEGIASSLKGCTEIDCKKVVTALIAEALMSSSWEFPAVTSVSIFVPFFLSLFPLVLAYCYDQQLISNLAYCPSLFSISNSMSQSVHEQLCAVPIMFNAWVGGLVDFFGGVFMIYFTWDGDYDSLNEV